MKRYDIDPRINYGYADDQIVEPYYEVIESDDGMFVYASDANEEIKKLKARISELETSKVLEEPIFDLDTKCKHCGKRKGEHKADTGACPLSNHRVFSGFYKNQFFEPVKSRKKKEPKFMIGPDEV